MNSTDVTVVVCTIAPRAHHLARALSSVIGQTEKPGAIVVSYDWEHGGHAYNRNKALESVTTDWVAFLDDDDVLLPHHLETLCRVANETDADLVYPWHEIRNEQGTLLGDLLNGHGKPFDEEELRRNNFIPVTVLAKTEQLRYARFPVSGPGEPWWKCEDWGCWIRMLDNGAKFVHTPEITWQWWHWSGNTSGQGDVW